MQANAVLWRVFLTQKLVILILSDYTSEGVGNAVLAEIKFTIKKAA